jgi:uncharacterized protein YbjT (DUF2867 family)
MFKQQIFLKIVCTIGKQNIAMKILTIGATGEFAALVIPELKKRGIRVYALVRSKDKSGAARQAGADEVVIADLNDPESLKVAARGMDGIFHINPGFMPDEDKAGLNMVNAAVSAGVRKFVFSAVYHPSLSLINHAGKRPVEEALYYSDLEFTILQPSSFMQNMDAGWDRIVETGKLALPFSKYSKMTYVDYRDVAEVAAIAMVGDGLNYGTFELSFGGMYTRVEVAAMISEALGHAVEAEDISFEDWTAGAKIPDGPLKNGLKAMYANYDKHGFKGGNDMVLRTLLKREPRTLQQYFREMASRKKQVHEHH